MPPPGGVAQPLREALEPGLFGNHTTHNTRKHRNNDNGNENDNEHDNGNEHDNDNDATTTTTNNNNNDNHKGTSFKLFHGTSTTIGGGELLTDTPL